jgi:hypothetical protein
MTTKSVSRTRMVVAGIMGVRGEVVRERSGGIDLRISRIGFRGNDFVLRKLLVFG